MFSVSPEDYTIEITESNYKFCVLGINAGDYGLYILGDAFLRSYLSIYDLENNRAGLAVHIYSNAVVMKQKPSKIWLLLLILIVSLLVIAIIGILLHRAYKKKQLKKGLAFYENYT